MYFTSDPIPELEHVLLVDPEVLDLRPVSAECDEVQSNVTGLLSALQKPHLGRGRVRDGFLDNTVTFILFCRLLICQSFVCLSFRFSLFIKL